jgi:hypothetical protein
LAERAAQLRGTIKKLDAGITALTAAMAEIQ